MEPDFIVARPFTGLKNFPRIGGLADCFPEVVEYQAITRVKRPFPITLTDNLRNESLAGPCLYPPLESKRDP